MLSDDASPPRHQHSCLRQGTPGGPTGNAPQDKASAGRSEAMESTALPASVALLAVILAIAAAAIVYFLPFIVGEARGVPHVGSIFVVNLFLGWTLVGWVAAMAMACRTKAPPVTTVVSSPGPGWYPDPSGEQQSRWWDGSHWGSPIQ
jgi:Superinfection immunity protein/Protein of unknown function (DUF2510)